MRLCQRGDPDNKKMAEKQNMREKDILDKIPGIFPQGREVLVGPGDDCAVLDFGVDRLYLMAVDQLISDIHYCRELESPANIAKKLLNRNLSDIAAMGGVPAQALLTMTLSSSTASEKGWVDKFLTAVADEAKIYGISVCGGDIASTNADTDSFSLTITGWVKRESLCLRSSARPEECLFATGLFGNSFSTGHHINFSPRLEAADFLAGSFTKAMIDVSDGLLLDSARIAEMSGTGLTINTELIPARDGAGVTQRLTDGEDYELLFAVDPEKADDLIRKWPFSNIPLTCIGFFTEESPGIVVDHNGHLLYSGTDNESCCGFDHLSLKENN